MKNLKIFKILGILALVLAIASCSLEPVINSTVTNYPIMTLNGDETVFVELGTTYNDPGVIATENGAPIQIVCRRFRGSTCMDAMDSHRRCGQHCIAGVGQ